MSSVDVFLSLSDNLQLKPFAEKTSYGHDLGDD